MLGTINMPHVRSIMILLEIKLAINGNSKIFYENIYEGDEVIVLTWFLIPSIGHYHCLHNSIN
jgi:hypothetical protein